MAASGSKGITPPPQMINSGDPPRTPEQLAEAARRLGLPMRDERLFQQALTHRSYLNENPTAALKDNERLEFLGDSVLDFLAAQWLYERLPDQQEGTLTQLRAGMVSNAPLAVYAGEIGLGGLILMGRGEETGGGRAKTSNLSQTLEAVLGALYLDQGLEATRAYISPYFERRLPALLSESGGKDAKSRLQEWALGHGLPAPHYTLISQSGPEHAPVFTVAVWVGGQQKATGSGTSKRRAEQAAAQSALLVVSGEG